MSIENLIVSILGKNRKSIDVNLNIELTNISFEVLDSENNLIVTRTVDNSLNPSPQNFTLLCGGTPPEVGSPEYNAIESKLNTDAYYYPTGYAVNEVDVLYQYEAENLFDYNAQYTLIIKENGLEISKTAFTIEPHAAMLKPELTPCGNRLLKVTFPYPIKHWETYNTYITGADHVESLSNFYLNFYDYDENTSNVANPQWSGHITTKASNETDDDKLSHPYLVTVSSDYRSMLVQATAKSMPLGDHILKVAYGKNTNMIGLNLLRDFHSEKGREIPVSEMPFTAVGGDFAANAIALDVVSQNKVVVTFDKDVCVPMPDKLTVESISTLSVFVPFAFANAATSVARVPHTLNKLVFAFEGNSKNDYFPHGELKFHMNYIKDIHGLDTDPKEFITSVPEIPPTLVSVVQDHTVPNVTTLIVEFSAPMLAADKVDLNDALNTAHYTLTKVDTNVEIPLKDTISVVADSTQMKFKIETVDELATGFYNLNVKDIKDVYGVMMIEGNLQVEILDNSVPTVERILGTTNAPSLMDTVLIMFNEAMAIDPIYGLDRLANYKVEGSTLELAKTAKFMNNKWARISLNESLDLAADSTDVAEDGTPISIGHVDLRDVYYVKNASGNVFPLCTPETVDVLVPALDIANSDVAITGANEITLVLTGADDYFDPNLFTMADFELSGGNVVDFITPIDAVLQEDLKTVVFKFDMEFTSLDSGMIISTVAADVQSEDILNRKLVADADTPVIDNNLRPLLVTASTINIDSDVSGVKEEITVALVFSSNITGFDANDFTAVTGSGEILKVDVDPAKSYVSVADPKVAIVTFWAFNPSRPITSDLLVSSLPEDYISTNSNGKRIIPFANKETIELYSKVLTVTLSNDGTDYTLANGEITLSFDKPIVLPKVVDYADGTFVAADKSLDIHGLQLVFETTDAGLVDEASIPYSMSLVDSHTLKYTFGASTTSIEMATLSFAVANPQDLIIRGEDGSIANNFLKSKYFF